MRHPRALYQAPQTHHYCDPFNIRSFFTIKPTQTRAHNFDRNMKNIPLFFRSFESMRVAFIYGDICWHFVESIWTQSIDCVDMSELAIFFGVLGHMRQNLIRMRNGNAHNQMDSWRHQNYGTKLKTKRKTAIPCAFEIDLIYSEATNSESHMDSHCLPISRCKTTQFEAIFFALKITLLIVVASRCGACVLCVCVTADTEQTMPK